MYRLTVVVVLAMALCAEAGVKENTFNKTLALGTNQLACVGTGSLSRWFIKGCDMALFVEEGTPKSNIFDDKPRALEFYYHVSIKAEQFATAAWDTLEKNFSEKILKENKKEIDQLHGFYRDVKKGDRYRLVYEPGKGSTLLLNGKPLGTIKGAEFAEIYFSVWLGKIPIDKKLKAGLIGGLK